MTCPHELLFQDAATVIRSPLLGWDLSVAQPHLTLLVHSAVSSVQQCPPQAP